MPVTAVNPSLTSTARRAAGEIPFPRAEKGGCGCAINRRLEMQRVTDRQTYSGSPRLSLQQQQHCVPSLSFSLCLSLSLRRGGRSDAGHVLLHFAEPGSDVPAPLRVTHLPRGWGVLPVLRGSAKVPPDTGQGVTELGTRPRSPPDPPGVASLPRHKWGQSLRPAAHLGTGKEGV